MKETATTDFTHNNNISVVCSYCCKLIRVSASWRQGNAEQVLHESVELSHGICPECLLEHYPNEYLTIQRDNRLRIKKTYSIQHCEVTKLSGQ